MLKNLVLLFIYVNIFIKSHLFAEEININFSKLKLNELIKISSQILNKDILMSENFDIEINYISSNSIKKSELFNILNAILEEQGYFLEDFNSFYKISKKSNSTNFTKEILIYELKNSEVQTVFKILEELISKQDNQKAIITKNDETNSIIIFANSLELKSYEKLINSLDKEKLQVYIEAKIIEVNNELVNNVGVSYGLTAASSSSGGIVALSTKLNGGSSAIDSAISALGIDIKNQNLKSGISLAASLNLLNQKGALDIVSEPSILAINNKESFIYVGEKISMQTSNSITDGGTSKSNYEREDVGLTLKVKPRISEENRVILEINALLEGLKINSVGVGENPDTLKKEISTSVILNNGESVIIGGLIENKNENLEDKVPFLGDIPFIGALFRNQYTKNKKSNLVVIVTPYIVPKDEGVSFIREKLSKLKDIEDKFLAQSLENLEKEQENIKYKKEKFVKNDEIIELNREKTEERYQKFLKSLEPQSDSF
ncbi:general secretion pathway protein GspD [Aliarcobacter thereius]|uniref:General secretion pathway protein GspD n=1 Tax=Aliarcobacter thereius TaxID=544718 RepID=A0A5R9H8V4_9BACT|nr:general secretion pathway protein GspD [Aliarcobacter thereius]